MNVIRRDKLSYTLSRMGRGFSVCNGTGATLPVPFL
jgi:hypothetical protein